MGSESMLRRYKRYAKYLADWIFKEKIRGLDFTMRDKRLIYQSGGVLHGYSKTDETHARKIFEELMKLDSLEKMALLDVGCGKGAFLREASRYPFMKIAGIEYLDDLVKIAEKNFHILKLNEKIKVYRADAKEFDHYGAFNVFYFFNPFDEEIMDKVMKRILECCKGRFWVILHNPLLAEIVENFGGVEKCRLYDEMKSYETVIYEIKVI